MREWTELLILGAVVLLRVVMAIIIHYEIRSERQLLDEKKEDKPGEQPGEPKKKPPIIRL